MSTTQSQPLLISLESKVHSGPLSSTSSTSSSFSENATTRAMRSATVSSTASSYTMSNFSERCQFSPYPQRSSRRGTVSGDTRRHSHNHSPPTPSMLLDSLSSPHRSMMYPPNPPSSNSPSPSIAPSVLLPDNSPSMTSPNYHYPDSSSSTFGPSYFMPFNPMPGTPSEHAIPRQPPLPPFPISNTPPMHTRERELEEEIKDLQGRIRSMESMLSSTHTNGAGDHSPRSGQPRFSHNGTMFSYNNVLGTPPSDWERRTGTRERIFCSLNRAGNALCAWHDSRRERRMYPPRMAPPRTLNCGCTYEQALFEESLARNGVGSYWPGDSVRMDPALRNALLALLEEKYNYRDGDFERNPDGTWKEGQDAAAWEEKSLRPLRRERP